MKRISDCGKAGNRRELRKMKKWQRIAALAGLLAVVAAASGCQMKNYEKIELPGTSQEGKAGEDAAGGEASRDTEEADGTGTGMGGGNAAGAENPMSDGQQPEAGRSAVKAELTKETAPDLEARDETVYVNATDLNVRTAPSSSASIAAKLNRGASLKRTGYSQSWSRVIYQDKECYVASQYLTVTRPEEPQTAAASTDSAASAQAGEVGLNPDWKYAGYSKIHSGKAALYRAEGANRKGKVVCVNAGHGTKGGSSVKTQCHPDGTPKVTGGTTAAGATTAAAISSGMTFADGTPEAQVTLALAKVLKDKLLARGFDVLMIRETDDMQLDNVARTVLANNMANCHIALHYDSTSSDKGAFYMSVPNVASYRSMEPVASHWQEHHALGDHLIAGLKGVGVKIFSNGKMEMDLTQTSYSTVPSVDIELGDKASDHSAASLDKLGNGLADGVEMFFGAS